jgi:hypothetical protein
LNILPRIFFIKKLEGLVEFKNRYDQHMPFLHDGEVKEEKDTRKIDIVYGEARRDPCQRNQGHTTLSGLCVV